MYLNWLHKPFYFFLSLYLVPLVLEGHVLLESNPPQYDKAREAYTQAIRLDPKLAYAYRARGVVYLSFGRPEEAKRDSEEAQKLLDGESELQDPEKTQKLIDKK